MKRTILLLLSVASLLLAGSVMAQSDYGGSNQPADTTTATAPAATAPAGSTADPASTTGSTGDPQPSMSPHTHGSLPRTASDVPLVFSLGVIGTGALLALRAYRVRNAR